MKKQKLTCINCPNNEAKFKYMDELYCSECLTDELLEDGVIEKSEYDPEIHGNYEEDN